MSTNPTAKMVEALQAIAPTIIARKKGEQFLPYWTKIVQKAGVDLFAKADSSLKTQAEFSSDLTFDEIVKVHDYLGRAYDNMLKKWDAYMATQLTLWKGEEE